MLDIVEGPGVPKLSLKILGLPSKVPSKGLQRIFGVRIKDPGSWCLGFLYQVVSVYVFTVSGFGVLGSGFWGFGFGCFWVPVFNGFFF